MTGNSKAGVEIPEHIRSENVWHNHYGTFLAELDDPFEAAGRLHDGPEMIWATTATAGLPAWIPTRHELIKEAFADYEHFSNQRGTLLGSFMDPSWKLLPVESDPPEHQHYRSLLVRFFSPSEVNRVSDDIHGLCDELISKFEDQGQCEFVSEFSSILPNAIVVSMLGMPQDMLPQFLSWEKAIIRGTDAASRAAAGEEILQYLKSFIAEQKVNPNSALVEGILAGKVQKRPVNDAEILGMLYLLFVAGLDTVYNTMGWIMRYLAKDHALQDRLRKNPEEIPLAIEEFSRAYGVSAPSRTVAKDCEFHGVELRKGDDVILPTVLAGRDPNAFPDPHKIDIDRAARHVTFGSGRHVCLGVHLAKREMRIMIETFLSRLNTIHIPDESALRFHTQSTIGLDYLPLAWN